MQSSGTATKSAMALDPWSPRLWGSSHAGMYVTCTAAAAAVLLLLNRTADVTRATHSADGTGSPGGGLRRLDGSPLQIPSNDGRGGRPPRLYYCGASWINVKSLNGTNYDQFYNKLGIRLVDKIFPRFREEGGEPIPLTRHTLPSATGGDLLVYQMHQWCDVEVDDFPGRQLHINSEYYDIHPKRNKELALNFLPPNEHAYVLGTHEDDAVGGSIRVTYFQMILAVMHPTVREMIMNYGLKPKNTGKHFCLYANSHFVKYRELSASALSNIGTLHTVGACQGNYLVDIVDWEEDAGMYHKCIPFADDSRPESIRPLQPSEVSDVGPHNMNLMNDYRFALVMENIKSRGYVTEKILGAFLGGAVPIYYGTEEVFDIFNRNAFIYLDVNDPQPALNRIAYLERNPEAYEAVLRQPILAYGERTVEKYLSFEDGVGGGALKKRIWDMMAYDGEVFH